MRLFCIWNRNYTRMHVLAPRIQDALAIAVSARHIRSARNYRRFEDCTDDEAIFEEFPRVKDAISAGVSGVYTEVDGEPMIDGKPLA